MNTVSIPIILPVLKWGSGFEDIYLDTYWLEWAPCLLLAEVEPFVMVRAVNVHATEVEASNEASTVESQSKEPIELETITAPEGTMVVLEEEQSAQEREDVWESMNAPHCLYAYKSWGAIQVQNNCPTGLRVKVVLRYAGDTGCSYIQPGTRSNVGWNPTAKIDRVVLC